VLLRSLVTVNKQLGPALSLDFDSTGKPVYVADNKKNVKDYLYITSYALCWPVTIMTIWGVTMNRGRRADTRSLPEAMFGPPDIVIGGASMPRSRKPDIVIREVVLFQLSVTAGALIMILAFNAGVGNQEASEVPHSRDDAPGPNTTQQGLAGATAVTKTPDGLIIGDADRHGLPTPIVTSPRVGQLPPNVLHTPAWAVVPDKDPVAKLPIPEPPASVPSSPSSGDVHVRDQAGASTKQMIQQAWQKHPSDSRKATTAEAVRDHDDVASAVMENRERPALSGQLILGPRPSTNIVGRDFDASKMDIKTEWTKSSDHQRQISLRISGKNATITILKSSASDCSFGLCPGAVVFEGIAVSKTKYNGTAKTFYRTRACSISPEPFEIEIINGERMIMRGTETLKDSSCQIVGTRPAVIFYERRHNNVLDALIPR